MTETTKDGDGADQKPAPHCPVCSSEMTLTRERRDGKVKRVWVCPNAAQHLPPSDWWEGILGP